MYYKHAEFMRTHLAIGDHVYFPQPENTPTWKKKAKVCSRLRGTETCGEDPSCVWDPNKVISGAKGCVPATLGVVGQLTDNKVGILTKDSNYKAGYKVPYGSVHWDRRHPDWPSTNQRIVKGM